MLPTLVVLFVRQVVLLPNLSDMKVFTLASPDVRTAIQSCYVATAPVALETRTNGSCAQYEYSLMAELYSGALGGLIVHLL